MKVKVLVATHKAYAMPKDSLYLPVFVGKALHPETTLPFQRDDDGENISLKNPNYSELTAIYWGWKNLDLDAMGLVHYRRYLSLNKSKDLATMLNEAQVQELLQDFDIILPAKRNYFIESNESHYLHAHHKEPFFAMREVLIEDYPDYMPAFNKVMKRTWAHMFNMFIMKKEPLNGYCTFMYDVLEKVEQRIDITDYSDYEKRVYGFLSELLLDVWLEMNPQYRTKEVKYVFTENENWLRKGRYFLKRKLLGHPDGL